MSEPSLQAGLPPHREQSEYYAVLAGFGVLALVMLGGAFLLDLPMTAVGGGLLGIAAVYALRRFIFTWEFLLFGMAGMIMFVPARAYSLPIPLPIELEPYRAFWVLAVIVVFHAIFISRRRTWRPIAFGSGLAGYLLCVLISFTINAAALTQQGLVTNAIGSVLGFFLLLVPFLVTRQLLDRERLVTQLLVFLVWSGVVVSFFSSFEYATRINVFRVYHYFLPLDLLRDELEATTTTGAFRAFGSAQHPIALVVMLCMLIPVTLWLSEYANWPRNPINRRVVYGLAMLGLFGGLMAAISRTAVVVMAAMMLVVAILKPKLAGILAVVATPVLILFALVRPRVFETVFLSFLDPDSLIASQYTSPGWAGQGRLADLEPALKIVAQHVFFGTGLGSRIVVGPDANSFILDNQWLGNLMDLGILGTIGLLLFMIVPVVKLLRYVFVRSVEQRFADLAVAILVATVGYIVSMYFFDAFSFIQSFQVLSLLWAVGAWLLSETPMKQPVSANHPLIEVAG